MIRERLRNYSIVIELRTISVDYCRINLATLILQLFTVCFCRAKVVGQLVRHECVNQRVKVSTHTFLRTIAIRFISDMLNCLLFHMFVS